MEAWSGASGSGVAERAPAIPLTAPAPSTRRVRVPRQLRASPALRCAAVSGLYSRHQVSREAAQGKHLPCGIGTAAACSGWAPRPTHHADIDVAIAPTDAEVGQRPYRIR